MKPFEKQLHRRRQIIEDQDLLRQLREVQSPQGVRLRMNGRELLNFSSNDYLGLANHPQLKEAAVRATEEFGAGAGASRLICGSLKPFHDLEEALAAFKQSEACLTFSTGHAAALGTIPALVGRDDIVIIDRLVHACLVDAVRLSGARLRVFKHNDLNDLERILTWAQSDRSHPGPATPNVLVITESVFSMDGDVAPLGEIVELKERHGAWLMVDEAHATGIFGRRRSGMIEHLGLSGQVEIQMGTLGKAVGAAGGFICGSRRLIDFLINSARSIIFSTAPAPASAGAALAGIELIESNEGVERCAALWERVNYAAATILSALVKMRTAGPVLPECGKEAWPTPILPLILGGESESVAAADALRERGFYIPAIRFPSVARGKARLRMTVTADHTPKDINALCGVLTEIINRNS